MSNPTISSALLSSSNPAQLRDWYAAAFDVPVERATGGPDYDVLNFGGFYIMIDTRDDVGTTNPEPGRLIINIEVNDAKTVVSRIDGLGGRWLAELDDRDGSLFATAIDPDGNYVQLIQLSEAHRAMMS